MSVLKSNLRKIRVLLTVCVLASGLRGLGVRAEAAAAPGQQAASQDPVSLELDHFYNLEYDDAEKGLRSWLDQHPDDLRALSYLSNVILQREMFRRELLDAQVYGKGGEAYRDGKSNVDPQFRAGLFSVLGKSENLANQKLAKDPRDSDALYWMGVSHVIRAVYDLSLAKAKMDALGEAKQARRYHARLVEMDPNYVDAYLVIGTYDYLVGSLPWYTKFVASMLGYHGNRERGLEELKRAAEHGHWAQTDAKTFLAILYVREKRYEDALRILRELEQAYPRNFVVPQQIARVHKSKGDWSKTAETYDSILRKYESRAAGYSKLPAAKVYYQAGEAYARAGEEDKALDRYERAAGLGDNNAYVYRAELEAARIERRKNRDADARRRFERVARAVPNTEEGRAAARALRNLASGPGARAD